MKKSTTIVGLALTMLAVYAILNLVSLKRDLADAMEQTSALQAEIQQAQAEGAEPVRNSNPFSTSRRKCRLLIPTME